MPTYLDLNSSNSPSNQVVLPQQEAILHEDPLLSSSSVIFPKHQEAKDESDFEEDIGNGLLCKWENCWECYSTQKQLVRHIEKAHVEVKKGEHKIF